MFKNRHTMMLRNRFSKAMCFFPLLLLANLAAGSEEVRSTVEDTRLILENDLVRWTFTIDKSANERSFYPSALRHKSTDYEVLAGPCRDWFEFAVNGNPVTSRNGWEFDGVTSRLLENGGTEFHIELRGFRENSLTRHLRLEYLVQMFPNSGIIRQRLRFIPAGAQSVRLTRIDNQIRLVFPQYALQRQTVTALRELRMATWRGEILEDIDWNLTPYDRIRFGFKPKGRNLAENHMFHPKRRNLSTATTSTNLQFKGPILLGVSAAASVGWLLAYEHGSADSDDPFLALEFERTPEEKDRIAVRALNGAYVDGEPVTAETGYATVWVEFGVYDGADFDRGESVFWEFAHRYLSERTATRHPLLWYNTWGYQRDTQIEKKVARAQDALTEIWTLQEIQRAHEIGVELFVLDDGWHDYFGDWQASRRAFPEGLNRVRARIDSLDMRLGLWMALQNVDSSSVIFRTHPEWLVRNKDGAITLGRWDTPIMCFSSGFKDYLIQLCQNWVDKGVTFFKWDGMDTNHPCYSAAHRHGNITNMLEERAARSAYDYALAITDIAQHITEYNPDVVINLDVTEGQRSVGLAFLSVGRFFWMNNGAVWYGDESTFRAKSHRSIASQYHRFLPTVLQPSANYPHNNRNFGAQRHNLNTIFLGGCGVWGDLSEMHPKDRLRARQMVTAWKRVRQTATAVRPLVTGRVGASPEIFEMISAVKAEGQVLAFSGSARKTTYLTQPVDRTKLLSVLRNAYKLTDDGRIELPFQFTEPDASREAFVLENAGFSGRIESSTCWLRDARVESPATLIYENGARGRQVVVWPEALGTPVVTLSDETSGQWAIAKTNTGHRILIELTVPDVIVHITPEVVQKSGKL